MRVNNYESKQNFGMAFRFKFKEGMAEVSEKYYKYAIKDNATLRGHKQLCKEQKRLKFVDTVYDSTDNSVSIKSGLTVHKTIPAYQDGDIGYDNFNGNFPGKKLLTRIFNPKKFLPRNVYEAGEEAKKLDKKIHKERIMREKYKKI